MTYYVKSFANIIYTFIYLELILLTGALHFSAHQGFKIYDEIFAQNFQLIFSQYCSDEFFNLFFPSVFI